MAHKKGQGSSRNGRDSNSKRRGLRQDFRGEYVSSGELKSFTEFARAYNVSVNVGIGRDWTRSALRRADLDAAYELVGPRRLGPDWTGTALADGHVKFEKGKRRVGVTPQS